MTIYVNEKSFDAPSGATIADALVMCSPFGDEPIIATLNGRRVEPDSDAALHEGDKLMVYPRLIGG